MYFVIPGVPTVTHQASCDLPGSYGTIAYGPTHEVLMMLSTVNNGTTEKYKWSGSLLTVIWVKPIPPRLSYDVEKFITPDGNIVLHRISNGATHIYTGDFVPISQHAAVNMSLLAVTRDRLLYRAGPKYMYVIDILNMLHERTTASLRPPLAREWSRQLAVVVAHGSGVVMVADRDHRWLDVFSADGTITSHTQ